MLARIIESIILEIVRFFKEEIVDLLLDIAGSFYRYFEQFRQDRFTPIIIISRLLMWTVAGLFCGIIICLSGYGHLFAKALIFGSTVGLIAGLIEYIIDLYKISKQPMKKLHKPRAKKTKRQKQHQYIKKQANGTFK